MTQRETIWVIDDDHAIRWVLERALNKSGMQVITFTTAAEVLKAIAHDTPDAMITDIRMPGMDGLTLLAQLRTSHPNLPIIIMTAYSDLESTVNAYQGGAFEYLPKPFDIDEAVQLVSRACQSGKRSIPHKPGQDVGIVSPDIIGEAPAMQELFRAIGRLSRSNITVLINGESGTGKELVARALHRHSPRAKGSFIAINTAAIPKDLLESELFGHEKGAFTGAQNTRCGRFEQADGGTLFLDEIGDMPAELQTRLLRVLADGEFYRVGGHTPLKVDVRIIAATHQDLLYRVRKGLFREDLFHRLNVVRIQVPALRERREDIPLLLSHFMGIVAHELKTQRKQIMPATQDYLMGFDWPGNVRQLENVCRWLTVMSSGCEIYPHDLPCELREDTDTQRTRHENWEDALSYWADRELAKGHTDLLARATPLFERIMIHAAMKKSAGHRQDAARMLGWGRNTLTRKINELGLENLGFSAENLEDTPPRGRKQRME